MANKTKPVGEMSIQELRTALTRAREMWTQREDEHAKSIETLTNENAELIKVLETTKSEFAEMVTSLEGRDETISALEAKLKSVAELVKDYQPEKEN